MLYRSVLVVLLAGVSAQSQAQTPLEVSFNDLPYHINQPEGIFFPDPGFSSQPSSFKVYMVQGDAPAACGTPAQNMSSACLTGTSWLVYDVRGDGSNLDPYRYVYLARDYYANGKIEFFAVAIDGSQVYTSHLRTISFTTEYEGLVAGFPETDPVINNPNFWDTDYQVPPLHTDTSNAYWVDNSGSDTNPGTKSSPFKTIKHALTVLKAHVTSQVNAGNEPVMNKVVVKKGIYHNRQVLAGGCVGVDPGNLRNLIGAGDLVGTPNTQLYVMAEPGQEVVIDNYAVGPATDGLQGGWGHSGCSGPPNGYWTTGQNSSFWAYNPNWAAPIINVKDAQYVTVQGFTGIGAGKYGVWAANARNVYIQHNKIADITKWGIHATGINENLWIAGNTIIGVMYGLAEHAIYLGGLDPACHESNSGCNENHHNWMGHIAKGSYIIGNTVAFIQRHGVKVNGTNLGVVIEDNEVYRAGKNESLGAAGISVTGASGVLIRNNVVAEGHRGCIWVTNDYDTSYFDPNRDPEDVSKYRRSKFTVIGNYEISNNTCGARTEFWNTHCGTNGSQCSNNRAAIKIQISGGCEGGICYQLSEVHERRPLVYPIHGFRIYNNRIENLSKPAIYLTANNDITYCSDPSSSYYGDPFYDCDGKSIYQPFRGVLSVDGLARVSNNLLSTVTSNPAYQPLQYCLTPQNGSNGFCGGGGTFSPGHPLAGQPIVNLRDSTEMNSERPDQFYSNVPATGNTLDPGYESVVPYGYVVHAQIEPNTGGTFMEDFYGIMTNLFNAPYVESSYNVTSQSPELTSGEDCPATDILGNPRNSSSCTLGAYEYQASDADDDGDGDDGA